MGEVTLTATTRNAFHHPESLCKHRQVPTASDVTIKEPDQSAYLVILNQCMTISRAAKVHATTQLAVVSRYTSLGRSWQVPLNPQRSVGGGF